MEWIDFHRPLPHFLCSPLLLLSELAKVGVPGTLRERLNVIELRHLIYLWFLLEFTT